MNKNIICLWYDHDAEAAARFYSETFPDSSVKAVNRAPSDYPGGKAGDVLTVDFVVVGIPCIGSQWRPDFQAQRSLFVPDSDRQSGRNGPLLECDRRQRRSGKPMWLVQGQMGHILADHAPRIDRRHGSRRRSGETRFQRDDADEKNQRGRHRSGRARLTVPRVSSDLHPLAGAHSIASFLRLSGFTWRGF